MKVILYRLPILLLVLYSFTYSIEISQDTVEQLHITSDLYITNKEDSNIKIDSMKIILLSGSIFNEIYFDLAVLDSNSDPYPEFFNIHSLLVKENDTIYNLTNYRNLNMEKLTLSIPANKSIQIRQIETGTKVGPQIVTSSMQSLKKIMETLEFDYTVKLTFYQNGDISDYVIIKGFILINSGIIKNRPYSVKPIFDKYPIHINLLGRSIDNVSLPLCNNIIISQNPENRNNFYSRLTK